MTFDTSHGDMIHDAQLDYYGKRLATCSSDKTIKIFNVVGETHSLITTLVGHEGPIWQLVWAHPRFGNLLASCSYDSKVLIWRELDGIWSRVKDHTVHSASVNSIAWAPHEYGLCLLTASSDGKCSLLTYKDDGSWDVITFASHSIGANCVSWAPATLPGSLLAASSAPNAPRRFASGGQENGVFREETSLEGHSDWVRDVAFAPSLGLPRLYLASCSQDKTVIIWTLDGSKWSKKLLKPEPFPDVIWRVSWSLSGNVLAVSSGDSKVSLWKENVDGEFAQIDIE